MTFIKQVAMSFLQTVKQCLPGIGLGVALTVLVSSLYKSTPYAPEKSVVAVLNRELDSGGTGFSVTDGIGRNVIVTNEHVCAVEDSGTVRIKADSGKVYMRRIIKRDAAHDLCLVEGIGAPVLPIGSVSPNRFDTITVLGHPYLTPTVYAEGKYSHDEIAQIASRQENGVCPPGTREESALFLGVFCVRDIEESFTTVTTYPGNSGSPVLNSRGEVIGVINIGDTRMHTGGFISLQYLLQILNEK